MQTLTDYLPAWFPSGPSFAQLIASVTSISRQAIFTFQMVA